MRYLPRVQLVPKTFIGNIILLVVIGNLMGLTLIGVTVSNPQSENASYPKSNSKKVLATTTRDLQGSFQVNVPTNLAKGVIVGEDLSVLGQTTLAGDLTVNGNYTINANDGTVTASNLIYSITAGDGIEVTGGQDAVVTNTGVLSLQGEAGALSLTAGDGITIDGLTISSENSGSTEDVFKNMKVGSNSVTASGTNDTFEFAAGSGISLSLNTSDKVLTITGSNVSPWSSSGGNVFLATSTDNVGIGTDSPSEKLHVVGNAVISGTLGLNGLTYTFPATQGTDYILKTDGSGTLSWIDPGTLPNTNSFQRNAGALSSTNITDDILLGSNATSSALIRLPGVSGQNVFFNTGGNFGIGDTTPASLFTVGNGDLFQVNSSGAIAAATGLTSSGTITFSGLGSGVVKATSGELSVGSVNLASEVTGTLAIGNGGTGLTSYTEGDILYANGSGALVKLGIGSNEQVLSVSEGLPVWASVTGGAGGLCTNCIVNNPASSQTISPTADVTGLIVAQSDDVSPTADIFSVTNNAGDTEYLVIDASGNLALTGTIGLNGIAYTFPSTQQANYILQTDGSGTLSWIDPGTLPNLNLLQRNSGALSALNSTDDFLLGSTATSSALVRLPGVSGQNAWFNTGGNFGVGTNNPTNGTLDVVGSIYGSNGLTISGGSVSLPNGSIDNAELANSSITFAGDTGSSATSLGGTRTIAGGTGITTSESGGTITVTGDDATTSSKGIASFDDTYFVVSSGEVGIDDIYLRNDGDTGNGDYIYIGTLDLAGTIITGASPLVFEGETADDFETTFAFTDPTADRTITFPNTSGEVSVLGQTISNGELENSQITVNTGAGLSGGGTVSLGGTLDLANTGVTSLAGTTNQISVSGSTGAITLSLPQDIHTNAAPTFAGLTLNGNALINSQGDLRFYDSDSSNYVGFQAPGTLTDDIVYTLPSVDGEDNYVLVTNGDGTLSWESVTDAGGGDINAVGDVTSGNAFTSGGSGSSLYFHNSGFTGQLLVGTLTQGQTYTLPDSSGTICLTTGNCAGVGGNGDITAVTAGNGLTGGGTSGDVTLNIGGSSTISVGADALSVTDDSIGDTQLAFNTGQHLTTTSSPTFNGLNLTSLIINSDTITDFTGTGIQLAAGVLSTTLGTSVDLTNEVTGILPVANGGTGLDSFTAGDLMYYSSGNSLSKLAIGSTGNCLVANGSSPAWSDCSSAAGDDWNVANGAISPKLASTLDFLLGGTSTSSAKFAFLNMNSGDPTASISGNLALSVPTGTAHASTLDILNNGTFNLRQSVGGNGGLTSRLYMNSSGQFGINTTDLGSSMLRIYNNSTTIGKPTLTISADSNTNGLVIDSNTGGTNQHTFIDMSQAWTDTGTLIELDPSWLSTGKGINMDAARSGSMLMDFDGKYFNISGTRTYTGSGTETSTGNYMYVDRNIVMNNASGTWNITGDLAVLSSTGTQTAGTLTDSGRVLYLNQGYGKATGNVLEISNSGQGIGLNLSSNSGGDAALVVNKTGDNDIFTASSSGTTRFSIANDGTLHLSDTSEATSNTGRILYKSIGVGNGFLEFVGWGTNGVIANFTDGANNLFQIGDTGTASWFREGLRLDNSITFSGVATDITTGTNEDLTLDANGTGGLILSDSDITLSGFTGQNGVLFGTNGTGVLAQATTATLGQCLVSGAANPAWTTCPGGSGTTQWDIADGAIYSGNSTLDLLMGGSATASAKFAVLNMNTGIPTASISANSGDNALFLTGDGNLGTTNNQTLTLGGTSTGNIVLSPLNGSGTVTVNGTLNAKTGRSATVTVAANDSSATSKAQADYVTDGSGGTDDAVTIETAIAALPSGGGTVLLLEGTYYLASSIDIADSNITLTGSGKATVLQRNFDDTTARNTGAITLGDGATSYTNITITNLTIDGQKVTYTSDDNYGVLVKRYVTYSEISNTRIYNGAASGLYLNTGAGSGVSYMTIKNNEIRDNTLQGIYLYYFTENNLITNNIIKGNGSTGIYLYYESNNNNISNNFIQSNGSSGVHINQSSDYNSISNNTVSSNTGTGINVNNSLTQYTTISDNQVFSNGSAGINSGGDHNIVTGNNIYNNSVEGITIDINSDNNLIANNHIEGNAQEGIVAQGGANDAMISNNRIHNNGGSGSYNAIAIGTATAIINNVSVIGNYITDTAGSGNAIYVRSDSVNTYLADNTFSGTGADSINDLSSTTIYANQQTNSSKDMAIKTTRYLGIGIANPHATAHISGGNTGGNAALIVDQTGASTNDIFTASASGTTRFSITNSGGLKLGTDEGSSGQCLQSGGAGSGAVWGSCDSPSSVNAFQTLNGAISQNNTTLDFLLGGTSTSSAKFAVLNLNGGTPTASVSGNFVVMPDNGNGGKIAVGTEDAFAFGIQSASNIGPNINGATTSAALTTTVVSTSDDLGNDPAIAIGSDALPVIGHINATDDDLMVTKCNNLSCSDNSTTQIDIGLTQDLAANTSIAIGSDGFPVFVNYDSSSDDLMVTKCDDLACSSSSTQRITEGGSDIGSFPSIAIAPDGFPIIAHGYTLAGDDRLIVTKCRDLSCSTITTNTITGSGEVGDYNSIAIGSDNLPIISHRVGLDGDLIITKCNNIDCSSNSSSTVSEANEGRSQSLTIGSDGLPIIIAIESTGPGSDIQFVKCHNLSCTSRTLTEIDQGADVMSGGNEKHIAIGADGLPIISYRNFDDTDLMIGKCENLECSSISTTQRSVTDGFDSAIAIGKDGLPIIAFDDTAGDLNILYCANDDCTESTGSSYANGIDLGSAALSFRSAYFDTLNLGKQGAAVRLNQNNEFFANNLYTNGEGKVGIGTVNPSLRLDVADTQDATSSALIRNLSTNAGADVLALKVGATTAGTGNNFLTFMNGNGEIVGKVNGNGSGGVSYATTGIDFAEYYRKADINEEFEAGELVCLDFTGGATKCNSEEESHSILGVVSDNAGFVGGVDKQDDPNYVLVGIVGQLKVKVTGEVGAGDALTMSSESGVATPSATEGYIVGRAMESNSEGEKEKVITSIQMNYHKPKYALNLGVGPEVNAPSTTPEPDYASMLSENNETLLSLQESLEETKLDVETINTTLTNHSEKLSELEDLITEQTASPYTLTPFATESADFVTINEGLLVLGTTSVGDLAVNSRLAVGNSFMIENNSINTIGDKTLEIQSLKQGNIAFLGGLITFEKTGKVTIEKDLDVYGAIRTSSLEGIDGPLAISGSATFEVLGIQRSDAESSSSASTTINSSAGKLTLSAGRTTLTVNNNKAREDSLIFITSTGSTDGQSLYIEEQADGQFIVAIDEALDEDISFNFLIVN